MPSFLQPDLAQILSQTISFALLVIILKRFAWKPLLGILDARRAHIEAQLSQIAQSRAELEQLHADYAQRLSKIDEEARVKIQQAILEGKRISMEVQEQARAQALAILSKSKETIELEFAKAQVTLRDQMAEMTVTAVERILRKKLDAKTDHQLVDAVLDALASGRARG
jgi:F-type H+-transporting ATPase subunit b